MDSYTHATAKNTTDGVVILNSSTRAAQFALSTCFFQPAANYIATVYLAVCLCTLDAPLRTEYLLHTRATRDANIKDRHRSFGSYTPTITDK